MPIAKRGFVSAFEWDTRASRYRRRATGQFVSSAEITKALETALRRAADEIRGTASLLQAGTITLGDWRERMATHIKTTHLYAAAIPRGGWAQMTAADFGRVGRQVREQYAFLNRFTSQLAAGAPLDGRFVTRSKMYGLASRTMFHESERVAQLENGKTLERNILGNAEHCVGCLAESALGWVPIGTLRPIGRRDCLTHCRCRIRYK